jgi:hypothetical protein
MTFPENWISERMDDLVVVWLPGVNRYLQLQEPAWQVFRRLATGTPHPDIATMLLDTWGLPRREALRFVAEIAGHIEQALHPDSGAPEIPGSAVREALLNPDRPVVEIHYRLGSHGWTIRFPDMQFAGFIRPMILHLETDAPLPGSALFEFAEKGEMCGLFFNDELVFAGNDRMALNGKFYVSLVSFLSGIAPENWMTVCHASAATDGFHSVMLTGPSGTGKSTLTGLLSACGLSFVADDFVAVGGEACAAYPFPTALSVKHGAVDLLASLYDDLPTREVYTHLRVDKEIRFLPMHEEEQFFSRVFPVSLLIFPVYRPGAGFNAEMLSPGESLRLYMEQAWISACPEHAARFLRWFKSLRCYRITYSDNDQAVQFIRSELSR